MEDYKDWLNDYFGRYQKDLFREDIRPLLHEFYELCLDVQAGGKKLIFAGNGASASISGHAAVDFTKQAKVRAVNFNEAGLITAFANDFGYEQWVAKAVEMYGDQGDVAVMISCSGNSPNVVNAAAYAKAHGMKVVTFTGHSPDNKLKSMGDINFWVDSKAYNIIEGIHMIWVTAVVDMILGEAEYSVS